MRWGRLQLGHWETNQEPFNWEWFQYRSMRMLMIVIVAWSSFSNSFWNYYSLWGDYCCVWHSNVGVFATIKWQNKVLEPRKRYIKMYVEFHRNLQQKNHMMHSDVQAPYTSSVQHILNCLVQCIKHLRNIKQRTKLPAWRKNVSNVFPSPRVNPSVFPSKTRKNPSCLST